MKVCGMNLRIINRRLQFASWNWNQGPWGPQFESLYWDLGRWLWIWFFKLKLGPLEFEFENSNWNFGCWNLNLNFQIETWAAWVWIWKFKLKLWLLEFEFEFSNWNLGRWDLSLKFQNEVLQSVFVDSSPITKFLPIRWIMFHAYHIYESCFDTTKCKSILLF